MPTGFGAFLPQLRGLALSSDPASMAQAAKYYEQKGQPSKAWWTEEELCYPSSHNHLPGGFKYFLFSTIFGEDSQFDKYFWDGLKPPTSHDFNKMVPLNWQDGYFAMRRVIGWKFSGINNPPEMVDRGKWDLSNISFLSFWGWKIPLKFFGRKGHPWHDLDRFLLLFFSKGDLFADIPWFHGKWKSTISKTHHF